MDQTEDIVGAEPTEPVQTEDLSGAEPVVAEKANDIWGADRPDDTLLDDLSTTTEEEVQSEEAALGSNDVPATEKTPVQARIDSLTKGRKEVEEALAQKQSANDYLTQEIARLKAEVIQAPQTPEAKAPVWEEFEEKHVDDPDKAKVEYLAARQDFALDQKFASQKQNEILRLEKIQDMDIAKRFQEEANSAEIEAKYPDFKAKVFSPNVKFNNAKIAILVQASDHRMDLAYRIANDSVLLAKINSSTKEEAGVIIGKLEGLYGSPVNKRLQTKSPKAVPSIGTDNKALVPNEEDMDIDDFLAIEDKRQRANGGW